MGQRLDGSQRLQDVLSGVPKGPILVGFSGGLDSALLLDLLAEDKGIRARGLRAIHIHHGLQACADGWAEHCQDVCGKLGLDLTVVPVHVDAKAGSGPEAAARDARHAAFAANLRPGETLALAHHLDDQAETVLLRLLRASGTHGLAAMRERRSFAQGALWRPLLGIGRDELLAAAIARKLAWIEDPSNADSQLDRNYLRLHVLPALQQRWPAVAKALARSAELLAGDAALLAQAVDERLLVARGAHAGQLSAPALLKFTPEWRARMLRAWVASVGAPPLPGSAIAHIESGVLSVSKPGALPSYRWHGWRLRLWRDVLHLVPDLPTLPRDWRVPWDGREALLLPTGDCLRFEPVGSAASITHGANGAAMEGGFFVSARLGGERIIRSGRAHSQSLKNCLLEAFVTPWDRRAIPLLWASDGELLAAGDLLVSARMQEMLDARALKLSWQRTSGQCSPARAD